MKPVLMAFATLAAAFSVGCRQGAANSQTEIAASTTRIVYSEAALAEIITPGMRMMEVTDTFGPPGSYVRVSDNRTLLTYMFPLEPRQEEGAYMTGFSLDIEEGRVVSWSPVMGMAVRETPGGLFEGSDNSEQLQLFLVTDTLKSLVAAVEAAGSADAAELDMSPNLVVEARLFAGTTGDEKQGEMTAILVIEEQDVAKLTELTGRNIGRQILIVCKNKAIASPTITMPITSRQFRFTVKNAGVLDGLRTN